jgi:hypothetical protein
MGRRVEEGHPHAVLPGDHPPVDDSACLERDEVEDSLQEALVAAGIGEVTGAGSGLGVSHLDVEVTGLKEGLALVRKVLRDLEVPPSTTICLNEGGSPRKPARSPRIPPISAPDRTLVSGWTPARRKSSPRTVTRTAGGRGRPRWITDARTWAWTRSSSWATADPKVRRDSSRAGTHSPRPAPARPRGGTASG